MSDDIEQTVSPEGDEGAEQPSPEPVETAQGEDDGDTLEAALSEFRTKQQEPQQQAPYQPEQSYDYGVDAQKQLEEIQRAAQEAQYWSEQIASEKAEKDLQNAISTVRGNLPAEVFDDGMVQAFLQGKANSNEDIYNAWMQRADNPQAFNRVVKHLGKEFHKKFGKMSGYDSQATDTRDAVVAAVKGKSGKAKEGAKPNYGGLNDGDFKQSIKDEFGFDPF